MLTMLPLAKYKGQDKPDPKESGWELVIPDTQEGDWMNLLYHTSPKESDTAGPKGTRTARWREEDQHPFKVWAVIMPGRAPPVIDLRRQKQDLPLPVCSVNSRSKEGE